MAASRSEFSPPPWPRIFRRRSLDAQTSLWLTAQRFDHPARHIAFEELVQAVEETQARRDRLTKQMQTRAVVVASTSGDAIQALRGVALISAIILVAEIGDFHRFANPRQLMAYLGLTPRAG